MEVHKKSYTSISNISSSGNSVHKHGNNIHSLKHDIIDDVIGNYVNATWLIYILLIFSTQHVFLSNSGLSRVPFSFK